MKPLGGGSVINGPTPFSFPVLELVGGASVINGPTSSSFLKDGTHIYPFKDILTFFPLTPAGTLLVRLRKKIVILGRNLYTF